MPYQQYNFTLSIKATKIKKGYAVYKIICLSNNKVYIGSTKNGRGRFNDHKYTLSKGIFHSKFIQEDYILYGIENFAYQIIECCNTINIENQYNRENYYIDLYNSLNPLFGYNIATNKPNGGLNLPESTRNKQRKLALERKVSNETRLKIKEANAGRKPARHSIEAAIKAKSKQHTYISPTGEIVEVFNISKFCRENNLIQSSMSQVSTGKRNHHKNWRSYK